MARVPFRAAGTLLALLGLCSLSALHAQEVEEVNVGLSAITLSGTIDEFYFADGAQIRAMELYRGSRSETVRYTGTREIVFFRQGAAPVDGDAEPVRNVIGRVTLPRTTGDFLLVFSRNADGGGQYDISAIPDDLLTFKPGMYRFINLARFDVALKLGDARKLLKRRDYTDVEAVAEENSFQEAIMVSLVDGGEPFRSFKGGLQYSKDLRIIYIISEKSGGRAGAIKIDVVPERISASR